MTEIIKDGLHHTQYDDGSKKSEENYKDQRRNGVSTFWYQNGNKRMEGNYTDGCLDGGITFWNEKGEERFRIFFEEGMKYFNIVNGRPHHESVGLETDEESKELKDIETEYPTLGLSPKYRKIVLSNSKSTYHDSSYDDSDFGYYDHDTDFDIDENGNIRKK